jgi:multidrug efflux pump subunit AcrB
LSEYRARTADITRNDMAEVIPLATDCIPSGVLRDGDRLLLIYFRVDSDDPPVLLDQLIYSDTADQFVPLALLSHGFDFEMQDTLVHRRNRVSTITVSSDVAVGPTAALVHRTTRGAVEAIPLPLSYPIEWGGEFEDPTKTQTNHIVPLLLSLQLMVLISVFLLMLCAIRLSTGCWCRCRSMAC